MHPRLISYLVNYDLDHYTNLPPAPPSGVITSRSRKKFKREFKPQKPQNSIFNGDDAMRLKSPLNDNGVVFNGPRENDRKIGFVEDDLFYPRNFCCDIF